MTELNTGSDIYHLCRRCNRGIFDKIFGISYTQKIAYHTKVPLLAFHHKQEHMFFV